MKRQERIVGVLAVLTLVFITSGCVDEAVNRGKDVGGQVASNFGLCGGSEHVVKINDKDFVNSGGQSISDMEITAGDTVVFMNKDQVSHSISISGLGISRTISPQGSTDITIEERDEYLVESDVGSLTIVATQIAPDSVCGN